MDATAWVAIAGIAGTLVGTLAGPAIGERMRRRSIRNEQLLVQRLDAYGELIRFTARMVTDAKIRLLSPEFRHRELAGDELDRTQGRVRVIATKHVLDLLDKFVTAADRYEDEFDNSAATDADRSVLVNDLDEAFGRLEAGIRKEVLG